MLVHVVLFNFKSDVDEEKRKKVLELASTMLLAIPGVMNLMAGKNIDPNGEFEYALSMYFDDVRALEEYRDHPEHVKFRDDEFFPYLDARQAHDFAD